MHIRLKKKTHNKKDVLLAGISALSQFREQARWVFPICYLLPLRLTFFLLPTPAKQANFFIMPPSTYEDAKAEHRNSWRLAQRQQQEQQCRAQLHQVEKVIVCKEVGSKCFGIFGVSEELVVVFSFLEQQE